jgi:type IV secretory pathway VirD2 relaxase
MRRLNFLRQKEIDIKLRHGHAERPRKLVPWWARGLRRIGMRQGLRRQQPSGSLSGVRAARVRISEPAAYARRSVVKASFSRNRRSGAWAAHARYLWRPGAQQELSKGLGFDSERKEIDMLATVRTWEKSDELMWRLIVSPEDADRLNLRDHVRELVGQMERDLETKLEWIAIDHHNTDDAHVHLLVRGVRDSGRPLEIDREYLRSGIRIRSQEIATRELGPRLEPDILRSRERAVRREQWTEIDRALQGKGDGNGLVSYDQLQPRGEGAR